MDNHELELLQRLQQAIFALEESKNLDPVELGVDVVAAMVDEDRRHLVELNEHMHRDYPHRAYNEQQLASILDADQPTREAFKR